MPPLKILIEGWTDIPHSYAIVNVFQLYYLSKYHPEITLYIAQPPYPVAGWQRLASASPANHLYPMEIQAFLSTLRVWRNEPVDIVYRIAYPFNIRPHSKRSTPVLIFYTMEFAHLNRQSFSPIQASDEWFRVTLYTYPLYFVTPSEWSAGSFRNFLDDKRNHIIPHGVDSTVFYRDDSLRDPFRTKYVIPHDALVFLHAGAMTKSKGPYETISIFLDMVVRYKISCIHLVLKCSDALYTSKTLVDRYLDELSEFKYISKEMMHKYITIISDTFTFAEMNELYNASDVYMAPYSGEGFNMIPLEVLSSGCKLIITSGGASDEYLNVLANEFAGNILLLPSVLCKTKESELQTHSQVRINIAESLAAILNNFEFIGQRMTDDDYYIIRRLIDRHFSWKSVVDRYCQLFTSIVYSKGDEH